MRILRFNHFGLLCHLEFPCQPIPSRGLGRGQSTNRQINSTGKTNATAVVIKPALPVSDDHHSVAQENPKEVAWAMPTTTRLQAQQGRLKVQASTKLKRMQRVLLKPKYRFQTTFGSKSRAKPTLRLPPFLASLPLRVYLPPHPLSPWERARERAKHEPCRVRFWVSVSQ